MPRDMQVSCDECHYSGSLAAVALHDCEIQKQGGRCEDYPACGHTDGDGCQQLPEHTSAYYQKHPWLMYEPGTIEYDEEYAAHFGDPDDSDEPPDREPSADQEQAWDERDDEVRGHALDPVRALYQ